MKHATKGETTADIASMDTKSDDAPSELVHNHKDPVTIQKNRFTPKQINARGLLGVPRKCTAMTVQHYQDLAVMHGEDVLYYIDRLMIRSCCS